MSNLFPTMTKIDQEIPPIPYDIWFMIIEMAIRPHMIVDLRFEPAQIEQAFMCLRIPVHGGEDVAQREVRKVGASLRVVCRTWKEIVDFLNQNPKSWVLDLKYNNTNPPLIDTSLCTRLNVDYYSEAGNIELRQSYPASILSIHSSTYPERTTGLAIKTIFDIISFPSHLKALHLRFTHSAAAAQLLRELETNPVPLTSLSLFLNPRNNTLLQRDLTIPTLETLFLSIPTFRKEQWPEEADPSDTRWIFPRLLNLSLTEQDVPKWKYALHMTHPFLSQLLHTHLHQIQALRAYPMFTELVDGTSPSHWTKIPKLLALSTDFYWLAHPNTLKHGMNDSAHTRSIPIQHLIQIDMALRNPQTIAQGIEIAIRSCTRLETVSLVGPPFRYQRPEDDPTSVRQQAHGWWETGAMKQLNQVCKDRHIELLDQEGRKFIKGS
ncbi:hypothetical protein CPB86DRAFT_828213 [Serendipita vermifera]|nr:hypothetical protein CPB86DRAFT_828213 [Serendipita vermifera]